MRKAREPNDKLDRATDRTLAEANLYIYFTCLHIFENFIFVACLHIPLVYLSDSAFRSSNRPTNLGACLVTAVLGVN